MKIRNNPVLIGMLVVLFPVTIWQYSSMLLSNRDGFRLFFWGAWFIICQVSGILLIRDYGMLHEWWYGSVYPRKGIFTPAAIVGLWSLAALTYLDCWFLKLLGESGFWFGLAKVAALRIFTPAIAIVTVIWLYRKRKLRHNFEMEIFAAREHH